MPVKGGVLRTRRTIDPGVTIEFTWYGGTYVDIAKVGNRGSSEVINLWDYRKVDVCIPFRLDALEQHVDEWIESYGELGRVDLVHVVRHVWSRHR